MSTCASSRFDLCGLFEIISQALKNFYKVIDCADDLCHTEENQLIRRKTVIVETNRLYLREMTRADYPVLCKILQDAEVMYAYEHAFSDDEVKDWLGRQCKRYADDGFGLWAVVLKETGEMIGQCGLTMQACGGKQVVEVGYLFQKSYWHHGYAAESAIACKAYAFEKLNIDEVYSIIRDTNVVSQHAAKRNGMTIKHSLVKHYHDVDMPHFVFSVKRTK